MGKKNIIIMVVIAVVFGGGGFFGGLKYAQAKKTTSTAAARGGAAGTRGAGFAGRFGAGGAAGANGGFIMGQVIGSDATSITVQSTDGSSHIIFLGSSTTIGKMTTGSKTDLQNGVNVLVTGTTNSDGSITAQSIQIRPAGSPAPGNGSSSGSSSPTSSSTSAQ